MQANLPPRGGNHNRGRTYTSRVNCRFAITLVRSTHHRIHVSQVPASGISVYWLQWEYEASLHPYHNNGQHAFFDPTITISDCLTESNDDKHNLISAG